MRIKPSIFLTSDTHFGHTKLWELWGREEDFEEKIIKSWNAMVGKQDVVLHLGDLTMVGKEKTLEYTKQLHGRKFLIRGNHDGNSDTWYRDVGFETIPEAFQRFRDKYDNWYNVLFTHVPVDPLPDHWFNIHGHLHGGSHRGEPPTGRHIDIGVDTVPDYAPIPLYELLQKIFSPKVSS